MAPAPGDTGLTLQVLADEGDIFPAPPFVALIWPTQTLPNIGVNACYINVTEIELDTVTFTRESPTIDIPAGYMIAAVSVQKVYQLGDTIVLMAVFAEHNPPYTVTVVSPGGDINEYGPVDGVEDLGAGVVNFQMRPNRGGQWNYRFEDANGLPGPDTNFFVMFSETDDPEDDNETPAAVEIVYVPEGFEGEWIDTDYTLGSLVTFDGQLWVATEAVTEGTADPVTDAGAHWESVWQPYQVAPISFTDPTVDQETGTELVMVDPGAWFSPTDDGAWTFTWQNSPDGSTDWETADPNVESIDGPYIVVATTGIFWRLVVGLSNSYGSDVGISNVVGPVG